MANVDPTDRNRAGLVGGRGDGTAGRVVAVIDALTRSSPDGVGVRELAAQLGISRSATHRILQSLSEMHVARPLVSGSYAPGALLVAWSAFLAERHTLLAAGGEVLDRLVELSGESVYLLSFIAGDDFATIVSGRHSDKPVRYVLEPGSTAPLHRGAAGKAILAYLPDDAAEAVIAAVPKSDRVRVADLRKDLAETRARGYALSVGERIPEACGIAAPFFADGGVAGSITITIPRYRYEPDAVPGLGDAVAQAGADLSHLLSAQPAVPAR
jgi:DNA-binding IclR family transcriptional regulator